MSKMCEEIGHDYFPRHERTYTIPDLGADVDMPPIFLLLTTVFLVIATVIGATIANVTINTLILVPTLMFLVAGAIYSRSRFNNSYVYDICKRCGKMIKP